MDRTQARQAALGVFLQYGYRKTSMEDIARAVGVSRQWIYQQFESKEVLFREVVEHALDSMLAGGVTALGHADDNLENVLVRAFDAWCGEYVEMLKAPHASEIIEAAGSEFGEYITKTQDAFEAAVAKAIKQSGISLPNTIRPRDIAATLMAASTGIKYACGDRSEYIKRMRLFIRVALAGYEDRK